MFEPKILTDISHLPKNIETNLAELEPIIKEKCELANTLVVSPDSLEECDRADADAAMLTKLSDRIKRFRLDWTASWQSPFEGVIAKCKDYERRLSDAAKNLRDKSAVGKDKVKAAKREKLLEVWREKLGEKIPVELHSAPHFSVYFDMMTDAKTKGNWLNKGVRESAALEQMDAEIARCVSAAATMESMVASESTAVQTVAVEALRERFELADVASAIAEYKAQQERIRIQEEAAKARLADARRRTQEAPQNPVQTPAVEPSQAPATSPVEPPRVLADGGVPLETYRLAVTGTRANLIALRKWGEGHGITFKNMDK